MKIVGTAVIVDDAGRILIGKRPEGKDLAGYWEFPGGKLETGETVEECIRRELKEELGADSEVGGYIMSVSRAYPHGEFKLVVHKARLFCGQQPRALVHQELCWVRANELKNYCFPPADEEIIAYLEQNF